LELSKHCEYRDRILLLGHPPLRLPDHLSDPQALHLGLHSVPQYLNVIPLLLIGERLHPKCLLYGLLLLYN
jgi:hypothetical protein